MADRRMIMIFAYDIARDRTRMKVAGILEAHAVRVQQSVFEARLEKRAADSLFDQIKLMLDHGDRLRMYALSASGRERSRAYGGAPLPEAEDFWLL